MNHPPFRFPRRAIAAALLPLLWGGAVASFVAAPPVAQAQTQAAQAYRISAGPLTEVLNRFGREAGILLSFSTELTDGVRSPGLDGRFAVPDALQTLLAGTGLVAQRQANGGYRLRRAPAAAADGVVELSKLRITAAGQEHARGPVDGYVARRSATGSKTDVPLMEVPQTVHVITAAQVEAQGAQSLDDALRYTPGLVTGVYGGATYSDFIYLRGFASPLYLDGMRTPYGLRGYAQLRIEPYGLERIEVLKGPASVLYGQNAPGGMINSVRKRPTAERVRELQLQAGSFDRLQAAVDVAGAIDDESAFSYRLTALARDAKTQVKHTEDDRVFIAPALTWRPDDDTFITLMAHYQEDTAAYSPVPAVGSLLPNRNGRLATDSFLGFPDFDRYRREQKALGYEIEHRFNETWRVRQQLNAAEIDMDFRYSYLSGLQADQRTMNRAIWNSSDTADALTVDTQLIAEFATGALAHTFLVGVDHSRLSYDSYWGGVSAGTVDIFNPSRVRTVGNPALAPDQSQTQKQTGVYLQDQIKLDRWVFTLGGRHDRARSDSFNANSGAATDQDDDAFTGRAGVVYLAPGGWAPYASVSTSFEPTAGSDAHRRPFEPTKGEQLEAGIRYEPEGGDSRYTLSAFRLRQRNVLTQDPNPPPGDPWAQVQTGEVEVRGVELEAKARFADAFDVIASYAYTDSEITATHTAAQRGNEFQRTPRRQAALWGDYTVPDGALAGFGVALGARYFGESYGDVANAIELPSYTLVDAALHYDFRRLGPAFDGLLVRLNVGNLLDKTYVASCFSTTGANCYYGNRRSVGVAFSYRW